MATNLKFLAAAVSACLLLSGCLPPPAYDSEYRDQFEKSDKIRTQVFASNYFPESYGKPQLDCGLPKGPIALIGEVEKEWFPRQWMAAREPSFHLLAEQPTPPEFALRFSYIPSFAPSVFIRVQKDGDEFWLIAKEMSGSGGYEPGKIARSKKIRLSLEEVKELQRIMAVDRLFDEAVDTCQMGFDGDEWIFERVDHQGYRMVKRWSPSEGAGYNLGQHLLKLAGWNIGTYCLRPFPYPFPDLELICQER